MTVSATPFCSQSPVSVILITMPDAFPGETDICNRLLADGLGRLHLRKPDASLEETARWLEQIEPQYRRHIVVHDHHDLAREYRLGGIHLNGRNPQAPDWFVHPIDNNKEEACTLSRSCHSIEEVRTVARDYDYVFLSPVFDSISKQGYRTTFLREELSSARDILSRNVYALGGITPERLPEVQRLGFAGAAMMGGFWLKK